MSSSNGNQEPPDKEDTPDTGAWGTIFASGREHALGGVERARSARWTDRDEQGYLERVKAKAVEKAAAILEQAHQEAAGIREEAQRQGYESGLAEAQTELEEVRNGMADSIAGILSAIEGQCSGIFSRWREDLIAVSRLAIEKITCMELREDRREMLQTLLDNAVALLERRRELVITVHSEDEPVLTDLLTLAQERYPDVRSWRIRADDSISPGGLIIESESSIAKSRLESRMQAVDEILAQLTLPGVP